VRGSKLTRSTARICHPVTFDFLSSADKPAIPPDASRVGRRRFIAGAGAVAGSAVVASALPAGSAKALVPGASQFFILPKAVRLADTRERHNYDYNHVNDHHIQVRVGGRFGVPENATAAVLTVTGVNWGQPSHVTVFPTAEQVPEASNLNLTPWAVNANMVTVKLGLHGFVDVISHAPGDKLVDVLGYYAPVAGPVSAGRFVTVSPTRVHDSRETYGLTAPNSYTPIDLTGRVPSNAGAVMINLTIALAQGPGHFTAVPYDVEGQPTTSSVNATGYGDVRAAGVVVPITKIGGRLFIKVYSYVSAYVIVDVFGYYTDSTAPVSETGLFVPVTPMRLIDTRNHPIGRLWPNWVVEVPLPPSIRSNAASVAINITGVLSRAPGHFTVSAGRLPIPNTSNVNWATGGAVVPNHAVTTVSAPSGGFEGGFQVYSSHGAHVVADLAGYFVGTPTAPQLGPYSNPAPPPAPPNWILSIPRLGLTSTVMPGNPNTVTNSGHSWHWTGTGFLGMQANVAIFGHRTEHGGPYRNIHLLNGGDILTLRTFDGREFVYRTVRRDLVWGPNSGGPGTDKILAATRYHPGTTVSLIACTRTDWLPTSLNHRIVVTFEFVSWHEY